MADRISYSIVDDYGEGVRLLEGCGTFRGIADIT